MFLGGAVLANLVSSFKSIYQFSFSLTPIRLPTRTTCGYPSRSGRNKALVPWQNLARDKLLYLPSFHLEAVWSVFSSRSYFPVLLSPSA